ncbi:MAG: 1-acyl-sn-glycerol-3-phosphate acyltransferase [Leptospirales bacterium]
MKKETDNSSLTSFSKKELKKEYRSLAVQIFLGWLFTVPLGYVINFIFRFILKYKLRNSKEVKAAYKKLVTTKDPVLLCTNHLTMMDSNIFIWAAAKMPFYAAHYKKLTWNIPAVENFKNTITRRLITYLGKCIPVDRAGSKKHHDMVLHKTIYLMKKGHVFTYFPEGGRSRTARIDMDNIRYGVGKLISEVPNLKAVCVYMRGDAQEGYSELPIKGETFTVKFQEFYPKTKHTGLRAHRDLSLQIMETLKKMEDEYFREKTGNRE